MANSVQNQPRPEVLQQASRKAQLNGPESKDFSKLLQTASNNKFKGNDPNRERISNAVAQASQKYDLPPSLILGVIKQESGFKPAAESHCGAKGLMQLMPATAKSMGVKDSTNIEQNIDGGSKYLRQMLDRYDGKVEHALAAYNAGPGSVDKHKGIPPYKETQNYVKSVMAHTQKYNGGEEIPKISTSNDSTVASLQNNTQLTEGLDRQSILSKAITEMISSQPLELPKMEKSGNDEPPPPPPPRYAMRV